MEKNNRSYFFLSKYYYTIVRFNRIGAETGILLQFWSRDIDFHFKASKVAYDNGNFKHGYAIVFVFCIQNAFGIGAKRK